jgi:hypothetical protein
MTEIRHQNYKEKDINQPIQETDTPMQRMGGTKG